METTVEKYRRRSKELAEELGITNIHVISVGASVLMARDGIIPGGPFIQALMRDDVQEAYNKADSISKEHMDFFITIKNK